MKTFIMIDMQNDFISGVLGNPDTTAVLPAVCEKVKKIGADENAVLLYTMDTHQNSYMDTQEGRKLPVLHCIEGTPGWELPDELKNAMSCVSKKQQVKKCTFGAKELPEIITGICGESPDEIELFGVCTDICVISNAMLLKAFFPEAEIIVDSSCCAGVTPETHKNALEAMKICQITVI